MDTQHPVHATFHADGAAAGTGVGLGIDAGGTYTDAVLFDRGQRRVLAKAKALTTYHDLVEGIRNALSQLPAEDLARVEVTAVSTTLATNAVVEGKGQKVGLLVLAPWAWFADEIGHKPCIRVPGAVDVTGRILTPLDEDACRSAVRRLVDEERCSALVVAGYATTANPEQANRVREIAREMADLPVVCAHETSRRLNAVEGARTAIANARLLPLVRDLLDAVRRSLTDFGVSGRVLVMKGDGTSVDEKVARERPIDTILSGPAASVSGAKLLTGLGDALVVDIGGTTTDCAVLESGHVAVAPDGARVGSWTISVDVVDMQTVALGGDSRIDFDSSRNLVLGPRRNIPLCCLSSQFPHIKRFLQDFDPMPWRAVHNAGAMDVLLRGATARLKPEGREKELLDLLNDGPLPALEAARRLDLPFPLLPFLTQGLVESGALLVGALTPTDLLHVRGDYARWSVDAARRALEVFSVMRGSAPEETLEEALDLVTRRLFEEVVRREVSRVESRYHTLPSDWKPLLDRAFSPNGDGLGVKLTIRRPIVGVGAPASALAPPLGSLLGADVVVPEHADVANAVGAIGADIVVREEIVIRPQGARYAVHATGERIELADLDDATQRAEQMARVRARRRALDAGAVKPVVTVTRHDWTVPLAKGESVFMERRVRAVASGSAFTVRQ
jgi:N-methylhydantoinase A/oxoprolinase/acetone carboxylase beta subunit